MGVTTQFLPPGEVKFPRKSLPPRLLHASRGRIVQLRARVQKWTLHSTDSPLSIHLLGRVVSQRTSVLRRTPLPLLRDTDGPPRRQRAWTLRSQGQERRDSGVDPTSRGVHRARMGAGDERDSTGRHRGDPAYRARRSSLVAPPSRDLLPGPRRYNPPQLQPRKPVFIIPLLALVGSPASLTSLPPAQETTWTVGELAPHVHLPEITSGEPIDLAQYRGKKVLIAEFASW